MTLEPPKIIHLDQLESIPGPGSLTWHPVRLALGIRAFGCNAYTAGDAGQDVVEPHTEDPKLAHQELYFVADPGSHRHAVAADPATTVLSFGGPPTFQPSAWEWAFQAGPLIRSDPEAARRILAEGLEVYPESGSLYYSLACLEAVQGSRDAALN